MYTSLKIVKKLTYAWMYYPNGLSTGFTISKGYITGDEVTGLVQIVEQGKTKRPEVLLSAITVEDESTSGPITSYATFEEFIQALVLLGNPLVIDVVANDQLEGFELLTNKQETLAEDGTGTKYPTVDAVNAALLAINGGQTIDTMFTGKAYAIWTGEGLDFDVIYPDYYIQGDLFPAANQLITLDPADLTFDRFDVIAVDATGAIKKTGIADGSLAVPTIDTQTELYITIVSVPANALVPDGITNVDIYKENVEFVTSTDLGTVDFDSALVPFAGFKCIDIGAFTPTKYLRFAGASSLQISDYSTLQLFLYLKASFAVTAKLTFRFINGTTPVSSIVQLNNNTYNYNRTVIQVYQNIVIPINAFTFTSGAFTGIEIFTEGSNGSGCKIDNISLQTGGTYSSPKQKAIISIITDNGVANATTDDDTFTLRGGNGAVVSAVGKVITVTPAVGTNYVSQAITDGVTTTSPSENVVFDALALKANASTISNIDNTSDANKPVSTLQAAADAAVLSTANAYTDSKVASVYIFKGNVANYAALPGSGQTIGWVWNLTDTGANYAWTGTVWDELGKTVDLSGYLTSATATTTYEPKKSTDDNFVTDAQLVVIGNTSGTNTGDQDLSGKANLASPTFTGTPAAPTATFGTNTTQVATTAFVQEAMILPVTETGTSFSLANANNGKITILTASCTVTIPNGLIAGFEHTIVTLAGVTLTVALGSSVVLFNNVGTTMAEKLSCTIKNRTVANNYITAGSL